ncbi:hypothetical protein JD844_006777 [Phrynosoma platyrhinos]|uniref:Uncharacterized protein n=1 Tax=Phrynosoma platyrhinos TaxID=52577 RepID=A0ABQ7T367_PHRPL|nr:hypothetical protein JD844_006777 [Phrynosoma platyrhinos]
MANIVKGLYMLRPEWVQMAPALFSKFIPNILPPAVESELEEYAAQDQKLQQELIQEGFSRGDQSRKRAGEELTYSKWLNLMCKLERMQIVTVLEVLYSQLEWTQEQH